MLGVTKLELVCPVMGDPPVATVYHLYWPAEPPDAFSVSEPEPQAAAPVTVGAMGKLLMVAVTELRLLSHVAGSKMETK